MLNVNVFNENFHSFFHLIFFQTFVNYDQSNINNNDYFSSSHFNDYICIIYLFSSLYFISFSAIAHFCNFFSSIITYFISCSYFIFILLCLYLTVLLFVQFVTNQFHLSFFFIFISGLVIITYIILIFCSMSKFFFFVVVVSYFIHFIFIFIYLYYIPIFITTKYFVFHYVMKHSFLFTLIHATIHFLIFLCF